MNQIIYKTNNLNSRKLSKKVISAMEKVPEVII